MIVTFPDTGHVIDTTHQALLISVGYTSVLVKSVFAYEAVKEEIKRKGCGFSVSVKELDYVHSRV